MTAPIREVVLFKFSFIYKETKVGIFQDGVDSICAGAIY